MGGEKTQEMFSEKKEPSDLQNKSYGFGIRHLQMLVMTFTMISLFIVRACMGVAVLAMSNTPHKHEPRNDSDIFDSGSNLTHVEGTLRNVMENVTEIVHSSVETFDWDKKTQSLILSSFFWGYACMQVPAGILSKKFGGKPTLLFALIANSVICCLVPVLASVGGWMIVCASRMCMGITQASLFPASHTLLGQWLPESERTSYVGIVYGGVQIGTIIAMPLSGFLADTSLGWKLIFYGVSGLLAVNAVIWYFFAASTPRQHRMISLEERQYIEAGLNVSDKKQPPTPWRYILRSVAVWALLAPQIGFVMSFILFFVDMPTYLEKGLKISLKNSALLSALPYIGMWIGSLFAGFLSEFINNRGILSLTVNRKLFQSLSQFGIAGGLMVLAFLGPEDKTLAVVTLVGIMTTCGFSMAGCIANQLDLSPNFAGVIISLINFCANCGSIIMPIATSYILQNDPSNLTRWKWVFFFMVALCVATDLIYIALGSSVRQEWDDPNFLTKQTFDLEELKPVLENRDVNEKESETKGSEKM